NADPERVNQQLAEIGLVPDEWDGDTIVVPLSAKRQEGLEDLLEAILLVADNSDIQANPNGRVIGTVIEAKKDRSRGVLATLLIQNGTLNVGNIVVVGTTHGRLRAMFDHLGNKVEVAEPSSPIAVMGLNDVPVAGDLFQVVKSDKQARAITRERINIRRADVERPTNAVTLEQLFEKFQAGEVRELRLIIKADVQGSLEPIKSSLVDLAQGDISINVLHAETGNIGKNDIMLATASKAIVVGFNVEADSAAQRLADTEGISIRIYNIIYRLIEDIEMALKGMLEPETKESVIGHAEVRAIFRISKIGNVAGCYVLDGELQRNARVRVMRGKETQYDGEVASLKHIQDDVTEVRTGFECGVTLKGFNDFETGDIIECYIVEEVPI
ncbi:MAG: translation initiation factor IF-2, partial [Anaerolineales bacterium]